MKLEIARALFSIIDPPLHIFSKSAMGVIGGKVNSPETLIRWVNAATRPEDFYVCLNPSTTSSIKPSIDDITALRFWLIDLDPLDDRGFSPVACTEVLSEMFGRIPAYYHVFSGRGRQLWLPIDSGAIFDNPEAQYLIRGCTQELVRRGERIFRENGFKVDTSCAEISHLARLPGTTNTKTGKEAWIELDDLSWPILNYGPELISDEMQTYKANAPEPEHCNKTDFSTKEGLLGLFSALTWRNRAFILSGQDSHLGSRHERTFSCCKQLHALGVPSELALTLLQTGASLSTPNLLRTDPGFVERTWKGIYEPSQR